MLNNKLNNIGVVILAAGRGTRLNCVDKPKVMCEIGGKPIVSYIIDTLKTCGISKDNIFLVVGFHKEKIEEYFGSGVNYAEQTELKGTAHAAFIGMQKLPQNVNQVFVINGDDSAFYSGKTISLCIKKSYDSGSTSQRQHA